MKRETVARWSLMIVTATSTLIATGCFGYVLLRNHVSPIDLVQLLLFVCLFALVSFSFWSVLAGLLTYPRPTTPVRVARDREPAADVTQAKADTPGRVALLIPIYQEDPARVFAGVEATLHELCDAGLGERFDVFVLSDTRDADLWITEERCWQEVVERNANRGPGVYYRRRKRNTSRKSGNVQEFITRYGGAYELMVIYDADSLMSGQTLAHLVRRMDAEPDLGILQVPPRPVNRNSLFARLQQYAAAVYGPVFANGLRLWTENDGNYWGHNAIIRIRAFAAHCGLPILPGKPPLGGEILSHDFVEAALMRKAGYKVRLAEDLNGSYEECPTTLIDFAKRDQRWCQGNLQHAALVARQGLHPISRAHLVMGILSFVSSPLWALFILFGITGVLFDLFVYEITPELYLHWGWTAGVFGVTMLMLVLPKVIGTVHASGRTIERFNEISLYASTALEVCVSVIVAPIFMAFHTRFVLATLAGWSVEWGAQQRTESGTAFRDAVHAHGWQTIAGVLLAISSYALAPGLFWWLTPVSFGLIFSIPLSILISSQRLGRFAYRLGLLMIPEEIEQPRVIQRLHQAEPHYRQLVEQFSDTDPLTHLLHDPELLSVHLRILAVNPDYHGERDTEHKRECGLAFHGGSAYLKPSDRERLMQSPASLLYLHEQFKTGPSAGTPPHVG